MKPGTKSIIWKIRKKKIFNQNSKKKKELKKKMRRDLGTSGTSLNVPTPES